MTTAEQGVRKLITTMRKHGYAPTILDDGLIEESVSDDDSLVKAVMGLEVSWVEFRSAQGKAPVRAMLIPENGEDVVFDYDYPISTTTEQVQALDKIFKEACINV